MQGGFKGGLEFPRSGLVRSF